MITIREMTKDDIGAVLEIYSLGLEEGRSTFNTECPTPEAWDAGHLPICRLVACDGDTVAGWIEPSAPPAPAPATGGCVR